MSLIIKIIISVFAGMWLGYILYMVINHPPWRPHSE